MFFVYLKNNYIYSENIKECEQICKQLEFISFFVYFPIISIVSLKKIIFKFSNSITWLSLSLSFSP